MNMGHDWRDYFFKIFTLIGESIHKVSLTHHRKEFLIIYFLHHIPSSHMQLVFMHHY